MPSKKARQVRKTFAWLFPASGRYVAESGDSYWRIRGSGVNGSCEDAETTNTIVAFLESVRIPVERSGSSGFCTAESWTLEAEFLDGGLSAETGNYIGNEKGARIQGSRAALFVALGIGLWVPQSFRDRYSLTNATLEELKSEAIRAGQNPGIVA